MLQFWQFCFGIDIVIRFLSIPFFRQSKSCTLNEKIYSHANIAYIFLELYYNGNISLFPKENYKASNSKDISLSPLKSMFSEYQTKTYTIWYNVKRNYDKGDILIVSKNYFLIETVMVLLKKGNLKCFRIWTEVSRKMISL